LPGYFYYVHNNTYAEDITYKILKGETGGAKVNGAVELAIPWFVLYGENYTKIFPSVSIKFIVCIVGVDGTNAADTIPDNTAVPKNNSFEQTLLDYFARIDKIDDDPPVISNFRIENVTASSAEIHWSTNEPATTQVLYGTTTEYGNSSSIDYTLTTEHVVVLKNLSEGKRYYVKAISVDASNNTRSYPSALTELDKVYFETLSESIAGDNKEEPKLLSQHDLVLFGLYLLASLLLLYAIFRIARTGQLLYSQKKSRSLKYQKRLTRQECAEKLQTLFKNGKISSNLYTYLKEKI